MLDPFEAAPEEARPHRLYFGHPINVYGTELQKELLRKIDFAFPDWEVLNPDAPEHQAAYQEYAKTRVDDEGRPTGMGYFFEVVLPRCRGGVFLSFRDRMFGKGVYGEAEWLFERKFPVWEITHDGIILPLARLDASRCLTRDATRERIRFPDGSSKPY